MLRKLCLNITDASNFKFYNVGTSMSWWYNDGLSYPVLTDSWTRGAASRHTVAPVSHTSQLIAVCGDNDDDGSGARCQKMHLACKTISSWCRDSGGLGHVRLTALSSSLPSLSSENRLVKQRPRVVIVGRRASAASVEYWEEDDVFTAVFSRSVC